MRNPILHTVLAQAETFRGRKDQRLLAIFDLDSTLFNVDPRIHRIMKEFAGDPEMKSRFPRATDVIAKVQNLPRAYHVKQYMIEMGLAHEAPEFYQTIFEYWKSRFFSNPYLQYDEPYPGAVEFVNVLHQKGAVIEYLTGRDVARMGEGTIESLHRAGFPLGGTSGKLILKPHHEMDDAIYKRDLLSAIEEAHGPVWFFENELENIELVVQCAAHVNVVFFDSVHSGKGAPLASHIPQIQNFLL